MKVLNPGEGQVVIVHDIDKAVHLIIKFLFNRLDIQYIASQPSKEMRISNVTSIRVLRVFLVCNNSQENPKTKTWRPCWYHKQKKLITNLLLSSSNMAAMTSHANEELQ
jgi:hypothetical protein